MSVNNTVRRARCDCDGRRVAAGEELLDLGEDPIGIGHPRCVVLAVDLEQPRTGNVIGKVAAELHRDSQDPPGHEATRVGTPIVGRIGRTSIENPASSVARAIPGLALMRSNIPS